MKITTKVFFKKIKVSNISSIPRKGPVMILANHPSTFMDPIVISTILNRKVFYLAKGELFKSKFSRWILPELNMIPVYRKQDDPNQMVKNKETFIKCFEHLEKGGAILMFPEGISITERKLQPIKTGAARIVLGAEERNSFSLGVKVITIGLNYENPHRFKKNLFINVDEPIDAKIYRDEYANDQFKACEKLTEQIRQQLEKLTISIQDSRVDKLQEAVEFLYKNKLSKELGIGKKDKEADFILSKNITKSVTYFVEQKPDFALDMQKRIHDYLRNVQRLGLSDEYLNKDNKSRSFIGNSMKSFLVMLLGFPIYVYGLINNYLAYKIPGIIAERATQQIQFRGPIAMVSGTFTFLICYSIQIALVWNLSEHAVATCIYAASLPISGWFAYWYYHEMKSISASWILFILFYKKSKLISSLISERKDIIAIFDKAREEYNKELRA
jgi:1-acyl-sn-glycerol-3-phosphate acyltransferase